MSLCFWAFISLLAGFFVIFRFFVGFLFLVRFVFCFGELALFLSFALCFSFLPFDFLLACKLLLASALFFGTSGGLGFFGDQPLEFVVELTGSLLLLFQDLVKVALFPFERCDDSVGIVTTGL